MPCYQPHDYDLTIGCGYNKKIENWCPFMVYVPSVFKWTNTLTHWGWVTYICVSKLSFFGSDNGLSPGRHQAIIWTIAGILLIGYLGTNFGEILIEIHTISLKKMYLKMLSVKSWPFCLGLNLLKPDQNFFFFLGGGGGGGIFVFWIKFHWNMFRTEGVVNSKSTFAQINRRPSVPEAMLTKINDNIWHC